ncbi:hypothetical protein [Paenibacillus sp. GXUN7292]|uniref:hypothetical protein n=1 Tax=Paenibacillus sp. GXUN7292 TaxID=3422499 RepID=UPI003D7D3B26
MCEVWCSSIKTDAVNQALEELAASLAASWRSDVPLLRPKLQFGGGKVTDVPLLVNKSKKKSHWETNSGMCVREIKKMAVFRQIAERVTEKI